MGRAMKMSAIGVALLAAAVGAMYVVWSPDEARFRSGGWIADADQALKAAAQSGRPVFLKLGALG